MTVDFHPSDIGSECDFSSRAGWMLGAAVAVSLLLHGVAWVLVVTLVKPRQDVKPRSAVQVQIHHAHRSADAAIAPQQTEALEPPPEIDPEPDMAANTNEDSVAAPPPAVPAVETPQVSKSILQMAEEYVAAQPLEEGIPRPVNDKHSNIFHPELRQALEQDSARVDSRTVFLLNNSTLADAQERVALDGKCFRLENLGGGGDRRAWYSVKCTGRESTSDAMARGLMEALERR